MVEEIDVALRRNVKAALLAIVGVDVANRNENIETLCKLLNLSGYQTEEERYLRNLYGNVVENEKGNFFIEEIPKSMRPPFARYTELNSEEGGAQVMLQKIVAIIKEKYPAKKGKNPVQQLLEKLGNEHILNAYANRIFNRHGVVTSLHSVPVISKEASK